MTKVKLTLDSLVKFSLRGSGASRLLMQFLFYTIKNGFVHQVIIQASIEYDSTGFLNNTLFEFSENVTEESFLSAVANPSGNTNHACKVDEIIPSSTTVTVTEG